jgi:hypothetical protein
MSLSGSATVELDRKRMAIIVFKLNFPNITVSCKKDYLCKHAKGSDG